MNGYTEMYVSDWLQTYIWNLRPLLGRKDLEIISFGCLASSYCEKKKLCSEYEPQRRDNSGNILYKEEVRPKA